MWTASSAASTWGECASASEYTATASRSSSRQPRMIRRAISPRLATRTRFIGTLQGDVPVLLGRIPVALGLERLERGDQARARLARVDHVVDVAPPRRDVRIRELLLVLGDPLGHCALLVLARRDFLLEQDLDRALGAHDGDFGRRPGEVEVAAD